MELLVKKTKENPSGLLEINKLKELLLTEELSKVTTEIATLREKISEMKKELASAEKSYSITLLAYQKEMEALREKLIEVSDNTENGIKLAAKAASDNKNIATRLNKYDKVIEGIIDTFNDFDSKMKKVKEESKLTQEEFNEFLKKCEIPNIITLYNIAAPASIERNKDIKPGSFYYNSKLGIRVKYKDVWRTIKPE